MLHIRSRCEFEVARDETRIEHAEDGRTWDGRENELLLIRVSFVFNRGTADVAKSMQFLTRSSKIGALCDGRGSARCCSFSRPPSLASRAGARSTRTR